MKRQATIIWHGSGKEGSGKITSQSKAINNAHYAWNTRFREEKGTNPEELIAAAHASCFTLKLAFVLDQAGYNPHVIETTCSVNLDEDKGITGSNLTVYAKIPGITRELFSACAEKAKNECPVSKGLSLEITMQEVLEMEPELINANSKS